MNVPVSMNGPCTWKTKYSWFSTIEHTNVEHEMFISKELTVYANIGYILCFGDSFFSFVFLLIILHILFIFISLLYIEKINKIKMMMMMMIQRFTYQIHLQQRASLSKIFTTIFHYNNRRPLNFLHYQNHHHHYYHWDRFR